MRKHLKKFKSKPLSWSSIASWKYDKNQWARKYLLGIQEPSNNKMEFGKRIGTLLAEMPQFLPEVPRYDKFEYPLNFNIGKIPMIGYIDSFNLDPAAILEYKTTTNEQKWNQKTVDEHGQLMMYLGGVWMTHGISPEKIRCHLVAIHAEEDFDFKIRLAKSKKIEIFEVKKTKIDILNFFVEVKQIYKEMCEFALNYKED